MNGLLPDADLWAPGHMHGMDFPRELVDALVANFERFSAGEKPYKPVPVVVGHDQDQRLLKATGIGAAGWLASVRRTQEADGWPHIRGDITDLSPEVREWIKKKRYRRASIEFTDDFVDRDGKHWGPLITRVALTGGTPPACHGIEDFPIHHFTDDTPGERKTLHYFTEATPVLTRPEMIALLQQAGIDTSVITDGVPDNLLAELCRLLAREVPEEKPKPTPPGVTMNEQQFREFCEKVTGQISALSTQVAEKDQKIASFETVLAGVTQQIAANNTAIAANARRDKETRVRTFCEEMRKTGRIQPQELEAEVSLLMDATEDNPVYTFTEGGPKLSALSLRMEQIKARQPYRTFTEKLNDGTGPTQVSEARHKELLAHTQLGKEVIKASK